MCIRECNFRQRGMKQRCDWLGEKHGKTVSIAIRPWRDNFAALISNFDRGRTLLSVCAHHRAQFRKPEGRFGVRRATLRALDGAIISAPPFNFRDSSL